MNIALWITQILLAAIGLLAIQLLAIFTEHLPRKEFNVIPINVVLIAVSVFILLGVGHFFHNNSKYKEI